MKKLARRWLLLTLAAAALPWRAARAADVLGQGDVPPDYLGRTLDGASVLLSQHAGKAVVISFWASWCPYCLKELPVLGRIQELGGADQVSVIAVNTESREVFRRIKRQLDDTVRLQLAYDPGKKAADAFGVQGLPHLVIIGRDGRIDQVFRGYAEESLPHIAESINRAIAVPAAKPAPGA